MQQLTDEDSITPASSQAPHKCPFNIPTCRGCQPLSSSSPDEVDKGTSSETEDEVYDEHLADVWSPAIFRSQLKEEFRNIFFPGSIGKDADFMYCRFLGGRCLQPRGASMTAAVDLLCLLQMGVHRRDEVLLKEASKVYDFTMASLKIDLESPHAAHNDGMLAAIWILHFVDSFTPSQGTSSTTHIHKQAAEQILLSRGPEAEFSPLAKSLLYSIRLTGTSWGMINRKPVPSAGKAWADQAAWRGTIESELINILLEIPQLLHDLDEAMAEPSTPDCNALYDLLKAFTASEEALINWLTRWMHSLPGEVYHSVPSSAYPHLQPLTKGLYNTFPSAIEYHSFAAASLQITYWIGIMQVKQSILELLSTLQDPTLLRVRQSALLEDMDQCADLLCQSAAFTTQPKFGYCGILRSMGPVHFASMWFWKRKEWRKLRWARALIEAVQRKYQFTSPYELPKEPQDVLPEVAMMAGNACVEVNT